MRLEQEVSLWKDGAIASRFATQETQLTVAQGAIDAIVSESELVELQGSGTTMYTSLSNLSVSVDGISASVSSMDTRLDTAEGDITSLDSSVSSLDLRADSIEANVSSVTSDVSDLQTWQRQADLKITDSAIVATVTASSAWNDQEDAIETAQSTASSAASAASSAQSTANSASSAASAAQTTANNAVSAASAAQSSANAAQSTANSAVTSASAAQATANSKIKTYAQTNAPTSGMNTGDLWIDTTNNELFRYNGGTWVSVQDDEIGSLDSRMTSAESKITSSAIINTVTGSSAWSTQTTNISTAQTTANNAATAASTAQTTANAKNKTYYQLYAPSNPVSGDLWIDTLNGNAVKRWDGSEWVNTNIKNVTNDINNLVTRMSTAESKITDSAIINTVTGSTAWGAQTTSISNARSVANSASSAASAAQATADSKNKTYYQYGAPSSSGLVSGDLWVDIQNGNTVKRWDGSKWVTTDIRNVNGEITNLTTRMSTAESKITDSAIVNTVTTSTAWNNLVDEAESVITQTASGIEMRVYENGVESTVLLSSEDMVVNTAGKLKINGGAIVSGGLSADYITTGNLSLGNNTGSIGSLNVYNGTEEIAELDYRGLWLAGQTYLGQTMTYISLRPSWVGGIAIGAQQDFKGEAVGILPSRILVQNNSNQIVDSTLLPTKCATIGPTSISIIGTNSVMGIPVVISMDTRSGSETGKIFLDGTGSWDYSLLHVVGSLLVDGTKSRVINTSDYGERLLYAYETATPFFGDIGEGVIGEDGICVVALDPVLSETIRTSQYQVFLQRYGQGDIWVSERETNHFTVSGEPGTAFGWELKAPQIDFANNRLEERQDNVDTGSVDYGQEASDYLISLEKEYTA